ncbi:MAG: phosphoribosylaminoimidazolesuccinocarboxamide synthase [Chitinophagales bacterium]
MNALSETNFQFHENQKVYHGKVRDVYFLPGKLVVVASDRISCFDHILPKPIPYKGQVLNQLAAFFLNATKDVCKNWLEASPDPNVSIGKLCEPIRIEMVIRGYLAGHAARAYRAGHRTLCGVSLPEGMKDNQKFETPIITPAAKNLEGHDEDASKEEILARKIVTPEVYETMERYTRALFQRGSEMAAARGLILVDTKYEFGIYDGEVMLIDEIHTPDSSRYFLANEYENRFLKGEAPQQLSKEFVREWLIERGFQGKEGQMMPEMPDTFVKEVSERYIHLYETLTQLPFSPEPSENIVSRIEKRVSDFLKS